MLDNKIHTFLKLCEVMNYRKTAEILNMTQPAVTQHIQGLEAQYQCKLFEYTGRKLSKTMDGIKLEEYARSVVYNDMTYRRNITSTPTFKLSIGATKTIGDYALEHKILNLINKDNIELELIIDNTKRLLAKLNSLELDVLMLEGFFDKTLYNYKLIRTEELLGICSKDHHFANKTVTLSQLFKEHILLRESGSGTRKVFEHFLSQNNFSKNNFRKQSVISSVNIIEKAVSNNSGVSFVYESVAKNNDNLSTFKIENASIFHEYNYVYLKNTSIDEILRILDNFHNLPSPR